MTRFLDPNNPEDVARFERIVPAPYRDKVDMSSIQMLTSDDPAWVCGEVIPGIMPHTCLEMHNQTGDPLHRCCCGFTWGGENDQAAR
jgi:hypothetical protein